MGNLDLETTLDALIQLDGLDVNEVMTGVYGAFERLYYAIKKHQLEGPPQQDGVRVHKFE